MMRAVKIKNSLMNYTLFIQWSPNGSNFAKTKSWPREKTSQTSH